MTDEEIEKFAIQCAKGNNGGEWATHYTEAQKDYWRQFVRDLAARILAKDVETRLEEYEIIRDLAALGLRAESILGGENR